MTKYTIYCGLNDKDTQNQIINTDCRLQIAKNIVVTTIGYGTISLASGVYTMNADKMVISENTIRIELCDISVKQIQALCIQLKDAFNQESVLIEKTEIDSLYF